MFNHYNKGSNPEYTLSRLIPLLFPFLYPWITSRLQVTFEVYPRILNLPPEQLTFPPLIIFSAYKTVIDFTA